MPRNITISIIALCLATTAYAQNLLTGAVTDDKAGEALPGAGVVIKGTTRGTVTGTDGKYAIEVSRGETVVFSFLGMTTQEIRYEGQAVLDVVMTDDSQQIEELVVIGYQTIKKADLTGAVSVFNTDEMKNRTVTGTVGDALGTLPGINVRTSGSPGSEGKVVIRGTGTFGSSNPLYVVDGIASGANRDFNFNDIESIQVLKDASAAAIYGSRAGNGVIIITTKQGSEGKMRIGISQRTTLQWNPRYNLAGRDRWIELNDYAFHNGGVASANHFDADTDWQDVVFKTGVVTEQNISLSGGGKTAKYFLSANYQTNSGTVIGTRSDRITVRANISASRDFGRHLTFRIGENLAISNYAIDEMDYSPFTDVYRMLPTIPVHDPDHASGYGYGDGARDVTFGGNPVGKEDLNDTRNSNLRLRGNAFAELELMKMLKYRFNMGADLSNDRHKELTREGLTAWQQSEVPSRIEKRMAQYRGFVFDNTLEFNREFGRHNVSAILGTSFTTTAYERLEAAKTNVLMDSSGNYYEQLDAALTDPTAIGYAEAEKMFSIFGRLNYSYGDRYLLSFTIRRDSSSKFAPQNDTGYFPSVSLGWRISNEKFFNVSWINDLKLRANYGMLGTSNIGYYDWQELINSFPQAVFGNDNVVNGMTQVALRNRDLTWEKLTQVNAGFDITMFRNRFTINADWFYKKTMDVLTPMDILGSTGHSGSAPYVNAATLLNQGLEFSIVWKDSAGRDFHYGLDFNGSFVKNKIISLGYGQTEFTEWNTKSIVGHPIGDWHLVKTAGIFRSDEEAFAHRTSDGRPILVNGYIPQAGDVRYIDLNDDGQITDADRQYCGPSMPKFEMGLNISLEYKGFDLQLQFSGAFGHKVYNGARQSMDAFSDNFSYRADYDPWTPENPMAKDPRPIYGDSHNVLNYSSRWIEDGSYLRLKQAAIGYSFPQSVLKDTFSNVRLYVNAQNILTFTKYSGLDPEFLNTSIWMRSYDASAFPNVLGVTFGVQLEF